LNNHFIIYTGWRSARMLISFDIIPFYNDRNLYSAHCCVSKYCCHQLVYFIYHFVVTECNAFFTLTIKFIPYHHLDWICDFITHGLQGIGGEPLYYGPHSLQSWSLTHWFPYPWTTSEAPGWEVTTAFMCNKLLPGKRHLTSVSTMLGYRPW